LTLPLFPNGWRDCTYVNVVTLAAHAIVCNKIVKKDERDG
jgi:hypothetical protein